MKANEKSAELSNVRQSASTDTATSSPARSARGKRRLIKWIIKLTVVAVSCVVALLLAEVALRVVGFGSDQLFRSDPVLGLRFIPSKTGQQQGDCYKAQVSINAQGWRSPEASLAKPKGVYRVLVLGDSFMAGLQVNDNETFASVLQDQLNRSSLPCRVEVLNFGVPSWGTDQQYLSLREYGLRYQPDLVLVAFYAQNAVPDNSASLHAQVSNYSKPFFDLQDGQLVELPFVDRTPAAISLVRRLVAPFRLYLLVRDSLIGIPIAHRLLHKFGIVGVVPKEEKERSPQSASAFLWPSRWRKQLGVYASDYPEDWKEAWAITEGLLGKIQDEAEKVNAQFLLVRISDPVAVVPTALRASLVANGGVNAMDFDKPSRLLEQFALRKEIEFTSLIQGFRDRIADSESEFTKLYLRCDGHWTAEGHRLAAELVAPKIAAMIEASSAIAFP